MQKMNKKMLSVLVFSILVVSAVLVISISLVAADYGGSSGSSGSSGSGNSGSSDGSGSSGSSVKVESKSEIEIKGSSGSASVNGSARVSEDDNRNTISNRTKENDLEDNDRNETKRIRNETERENESERENKSERKEHKIKIKGWEIESELELLNITNSSNIIVVFSNGRHGGIKIMPDRASQIAIDVLRSKNLTIVLREVPRDGNASAVYDIGANKTLVLFGIFKIHSKYMAVIDAQTGEVILVKKPWWKFLSREEKEGNDEGEKNMTGNESERDNENESGPINIIPNTSLGGNSSTNLSTNVSTNVTANLSSNTTV